MTPLPKIEFFPVGSTPDQIRQRIDALLPGQLESILYYALFGNGSCYKAKLFSGRKITCIIKGT